MLKSSLAIIGTAGRKDDAQRLSSFHFNNMYNWAQTLYQVLNQTGYEIDTIVSGGAAWADHVAVKLFLNGVVPKIRLYLPCPFDKRLSKYDETPLNPQEIEKGYSTGFVINRLHNEFSEKMRFNSFSELSEVFSMEEATVSIKPGFFNRNTFVAKSDIILAMTFGNKEWVKPGGTSHTLKTYLRRVSKEHLRNNSFHYDLNSGNIFFGAKIR